MPDHRLGRVRDVPARDPQAADLVSSALPVAELPKDPNLRLLAENPTLERFWDGRKWTVTETLIREGLCGIPELLPEAPARRFPARGDMLADAGPGYETNRLMVLERLGLKPALLEEHRFGPWDLLDSSLSVSVWRSLVEGTPLPEKPDPHEFFDCDRDGETAPETKYDDLIRKYDISFFHLDPPDHFEPERAHPTSMRREGARLAAAEIETSALDKVSQRRMAHEIGEFEQPKFVDVREENAPHRAFVAKQIDFSKFPVDEIARHATGPKIWIFEDVYQGFAIIAQNERAPFLYTADTFLSEKAESMGLLAHQPALSFPEFALRLQRFLGHITAAPQYEYSHMLPDLADSEITVSLDFAHRLLSHDGALFLKSTRTAGGQLVVRIGRDAAGEPVLASDSPELGEILDRRMAVAAAEGENDRRYGLPDVLKQNHMDRAHLDSFVNCLLAEMNCPIVEAEIPSLRLGAEKVECRIICQLDGESNMEVTASYMKVSAKDIAANISLGGHGRSTKEVLEELFRQQLGSGAEEDQIKISASEAFDSLMGAAERFAQAYRTKLLGQGVRWSSSALYDFALDIVPAWDPTQSALKFYLLEVQTPYGFEGLKAIDPDRATLVEGRRRELYRRFSVSPKVALYNMVFHESSPANAQDAVGLE